MKIWGNPFVPALFRVPAKSIWKKFDNGYVHSWPLINCQPVYHYWNSFPKPMLAKLINRASGVNYHYHVGTCTADKVLLYADFEPGLYIHGKKHSGRSGYCRDNINPASGTSEGQLAAASNEDIALAVESAEEGLRIWRDWSGMKVPGC